MKFQIPVPFSNQYIHTIAEALSKLFLAPPPSRVFSPLGPDDPVAPLSEPLLAGLAIVNTVPQSGPIKVYKCISINLINLAKTPHFTNSWHKLDTRH